MKKFLIPAAMAAALAVPAIAQQADTSADPFASTQLVLGTSTTLAVVGGVTLLVLVAAVAGGDGSGSSTTSGED